MNSLDNLVLTIALTPGGSAMVLYAGDDLAAAQRARDRSRSDVAVAQIGIWDKVPPTSRDTKKSSG